MNDDMNDDLTSPALDTGENNRCGHLDPQDRVPDPAAYLAGDLDADRRTAFEAHLVVCEACWEDVRDARRGRALAESLREPAPQSLRETVRALVAEAPFAEPTAHQPTPRLSVPSASTRAPARSRVTWPRRPILIAAAAIVAAAISVGTVNLWDGDPEHDPHQRVLVTAVAVYANAIEVAAPIEAPVARIGSMALRSTGTATLDGYLVTVFRYANPATGDEVVLMRSPHPFPRAHTAHDIAGGSGWLGDVAGTAVFCRDTAGMSWLAIGPTADLALAAGSAAGLLPGTPPAHAGTAT